MELANSLKLYGERVAELTSRMPHHVSMAAPDFLMKLGGKPGQGL